MLHHSAPPSCLFFASPTLIPHRPFHSLPTVTVSSTIPVTVARVRALRPATISTIIPTLADYKQFRLHVGSTSKIVDRVITSVVAIIALHLLPPTRIVTIFKLIALLWPLLHPYFLACKRSARLRQSAGRTVIINGTLSVAATADRLAIRVIDETGASLHANALSFSDFDIAKLHGQQAYGLIVGNKLVQVSSCGQSFSEYPYVRLNAFSRLCQAFETE